MEQLTKEQAIAFAESGDWKDWTAQEIVKFQLFQDKLCMPFDVFHEAVEKVLGRPVWTHEFALVDHLRDEYLTLRPKPTLEEILSLIPEEKLIILNMDIPNQVPEAFDECEI
jgi:hypothetical protein